MPDLTFEREGHIYEWHGVIKPSLTQILRAVKVLTPRRLTSFFDYSFLSEAEADEALMRGRWVHDLAALRLTKGPLPESLLDRLKETQPQWFSYYPSFEVFLQTQPTLEPLMLETPMYSALHDFCTTPDLVCFLQGELSIVEFKTGVATDDAAVQTAGQALAIAEQASYEHHRKLHRRFALELRADGRPAKLIPHRDHVRDRSNFLSILNVFHLLNSVAA
jgi:hypothetical protein